MRCPRDESQLIAFTKGQLEIEQCAECNGFFVNLAQRPANQLSTLLKRDISEGKRRGDHGLISPTSGKLMQSFTYRGVQLDYCEQSHSVWFDHGEYTKMFAPAEKASRSSVRAHEKSDKVDLSFDVVDGIEASDGVFSFVGDLVGDLVSGIDLF
jgi:Zn-finger nucleic acid-binding protein